MSFKKNVDSGASSGAQCKIRCMLWKFVVGDSV